MRTPRGSLKTSSQSLSNASVFISCQLLMSPPPAKESSPRIAYFEESVFDPSFFGSHSSLSHPLFGTVQVHICCHRIMLTWSAFLLSACLAFSISQLAYVLVYRQRASSHQPLCRFAVINSASVIAHIRPSCLAFLPERPLQPDFIVHLHGL